MAGYRLHHTQFFDTIRFNADNNLFKKAQKQKIILRDYGDGSFGISLERLINQVVMIFSTIFQKLNLIFLSKQNDLMTKIT